MNTDAAPLPPRYLRTSEAAHFLSLSARTLEKHRTYGTGPAYRKLGGRVVYAVDDLQAWVQRGAMTSTSDPHRLGAAAPSARLIRHRAESALQLADLPYVWTHTPTVGTRTA